MVNIYPLRQELTVDVRSISWRVLLFNERRKSVADLDRHKSVTAVSRNEGPSGIRYLFNGQENVAKRRVCISYLLTINQNHLRRTFYIW